MLKQFRKQLVSLLLVALLLVSMTSVGVIAANAEVSFSFDAGTVTFSALKDGTTSPDSKSLDKIGDDELTISANGKSGCTGYSAATATETVTKPAGTVLIFNVAITNPGSLTVTNSAGDVISPSGDKYTIKDDSINLSIVTQASGDNTIVALSNISLVAVVQADVTVQGATGGTISVDSTTLSAASDSHTVTGVTNSDGLALTASAKSGYTFAGFIDSNGVVISPYTPTVYYPASSEPVTISAKFVSSTSTSFLVGDTGAYTLCTSFAEACSTASANSSKYIIPLTNSTVPSGKYTIPAGTILLVPYNADYTCFTDTPTAAVGTATTSTNSCYRKLTFASGVDLTVNGSISVSAVPAATHTSSNNNGPVTGKYGQLVLNSGAKVTINNGANLYAWGFVTGDGQIDALDGSNIYEYFQIQDFRGGSITAFQMIGTNQFPFNQYHIQNVEARTTFSKGAKGKVFAAIYASSAINTTEFTFIGTGGVFVLATDSTLTKYYDYINDKMKYTINGDASISSLTMDVIGNSVSSDDYFLPINNIDVELESGTLSTNQQILFLPGSSMTVDEGATVDLKSGASVVFAGKDIGQYSSQGGSLCYPCIPSRFSPTRNPNKIQYVSDSKNGDKTEEPFSNLPDSSINNNGTVIVENGAVLASTTDGANIYSSSENGTFTIKGSTTCPSLAKCKNGSSERVTTEHVVLQNDSTDATDGTVSTDVYWSTPATFSMKDGIWGDYRKLAFYKEDKSTVIHTTTEKVAKNMLSDYLEEHPEIVAPKASTAQYDYTFSNWESFNVSDDLVKLYPTYTSEVKKYTIKFIGEDGTELQSSEVAYGATPKYNGTVPSKESTAQYTYTFKWSPDVAPVTDEATYRATFTETINKYTIKFVDEDGTELQSSEVEYGTLPTFDGEKPTKAATAQYSYSFIGWDREIAAVTGDATYKATFNATVNDYTITWVDGDGKTIKTEKVAYGSTPSYTGESPTKTATEQYTYTFNNTWSPAITSVTGDATYTAQFDQTVNKCTITWLNDEGEVIGTTEVNRGDFPSYNAPEKEGNAQYTYTFAGWNPPISPVTGDATYKATYTAAVNTYTITWVNEDGTVLETDENLPYGTAVSYDGATPTKESTAQYDYTFSDWREPITDVQGDKTYTAIFTATTRQYTITFVDDDGTVISSKSYEYGTAKSKIEKPAEPTKAATAQYSYTFKGWSPDIADVTGDATYTATYTSEVKKYVVTWKINDEESNEEYEYGTVLQPDDPTKDSTAQYNYEFKGWKVNDTDEVLTVLPTVTKNVTYTAVFESKLRTYTVNFINDDGTELSSASYDYGTVPAYNGHVDPTKPSDAQYSYTFAGWTPALSEVTGNITYKATFTSTINTYTIEFVNADGTVLQSSKVAYGETPNYTAAKPTKANTAQYTYTFKEWNPIITTVTGEATYTAVYEATVNQYTVKFVNDDGTELSSASYDYGTAAEDIVKPDNPTKEGNAQYSYTFNGWDAEIVEVTGNVTYKATYTETVNQYTIRFVDEDDTEITSAVYPYGTHSGDISKPDDPTKAGDEQYSYSFSGWSPAISDVTADATYKANYERTVNQYTVKFVNEDGTEISSRAYDYGTSYASLIPVTTPEKESTAQYDYTFAGWSPELADVTADATYTATYSAQLRKYTVTFKDEDGTALSSNAYDYGTAADDIAKPDDPTKAADEQYTYTFAGWTPEITQVTGDVTYTATYTSTEIETKIFALHSLTLDGTIGVNFFVRMPSGYDENNVTATFAWSDKSVSTADNANGGDIKNSVKVAVDGDYVKYTVYVAAKNMNDNIRATLIDQTDGHEIACDDYSVATYAKAIIEKPELSKLEGDKQDALVNLLKSMLNYGAAAQLNFNHNTDYLANDGIEYTASTVPVDSLSSNVFDALPDALGYYGSTLNLGSDTAYTLYFYNVNEDASYNPIFTVNGKTAELTASKDNLAYRYDILNIPAKEITDNIDITIDGTTFTVNTGDYIKTVLTSNETDQKLKDVVTALYDYNQKAIAYFNLMEARS